VSEQFLSESQIKVNGRSEAMRLTYPEKNSVILEPVDLKQLSKDEVLVKALYSGISRGTESLVYSGKVPSSEWSRMRCPNQTGEFSFPINYGYASVGKVISVGSDVTNTKAGDKVFVLHPHQDRFIVGDSWINVLPDDLQDPEIAVLSANMETALNANWDADIENRKSIVVVGGGVVGILTAYVAKQLSGKKPVLIDIDERKAELANKFGFDFALARDAASEDFGKFECVFHTSASEKGLQLAIDLAVFEGRVIEMSWYGDKPISINLGGAFHSQRISLISSQVGHVSANKRQSHSHSDRMSLAMDLLRNSALKALLKPIVPFADLPDRLDEVLTSSETLCPLVTYN